MPKKPSSSQSPIKTRSKNKDTHPGIPDRAPPRRSSVEVENERAAKAQAKAAKAEDWTRKIMRAAEFQHTDLANEDMFDATPHPSVTPKPWPPARDPKQAGLDSVAEVSGDSDDDHEMGTLSLEPPDFKGLTSEEESASEDDSAAETDPRPPAKRLKAQTTGKPIPKVGCATPAKKTWMAALRVEKTVPASNEAIALPSNKEPSRKPKKEKVKARDEINAATKKIEGEMQKKNGDMGKPTSSQATEERSGTPPVPRTPLPVPGRRGLKRSGAMANIEVNTRSGPDSDQQSTNNPIR